MDANEELAYLRSFDQTAVAKPQIVADNVLTGIFLTDSRYRTALTALLLQEAVEAGRRLALVCLALADRSVPPARAIARPLPGLEGWQAFAAAIGRFEEPAQILDWLHVDQSARQSAEELLAWGGLSRLNAAVRVLEGGPPEVLTERDEAGTATLVIRAYTASGERAEARLPLLDDQIIALGDMAGDFVTWTRDFLGAYLDARAGR
ncbi:MAG: hypothetical protein EPO16_10415 [Dehalococcoidia bacterium]|nr:MAG: hypothetical protein EPO16_10415 [Dehalococcoidia bacterium]